MAYLCNVDIGGTHTDGALIDEDGNITTTKVSSTPEDFAEGFLDALRSLAGKEGYSLEELLAETELVSHGTTVGTNELIEGSETDAALLTTAGAEDNIFMMRAALGRTSGLPIEEYLRIQDVSKPDPIIPRDHVFGVNERIDSMGDVVVELDEDQARDIAAKLAEMDIDAVAVCFLWSFLNDDHEKRTVEILNDHLDDTFVTDSSSLIPKQGEYERTNTTAINASIGPATSEYLETIDQSLTDAGYSGQLLVMQVGGGVAPVEDSIEEPIRTIDSGPVAGLIGCKFLAGLLDHENVIAADMGGTSFDIGLIADSEPITSPTNVVNQYDYLLRNIDVESIGSGGGSIAWIEDATERLKVGPQSAGADPGPASYDRGGEDATVTDADLLLGFLDPEYFLGGREELDKRRAEEAITEIADRVDMSTVEAARGIVEIANSQMADLIRQETINKGHNPRNFVMYAYGGAGPLHVPMLAEQVGVDRVVIPGGRVSSVWSALGISSSDILHRTEMSNRHTVAPFSPDDVNAWFEELEGEVRSNLREDGFDDDEIAIERYANLSYGLQVHELPVQVPGGELTDDDMEMLIERFENQYEELYGEGAGASETGFELNAVRCDGYGQITKPELGRGQTGEREEHSRVEEIFWPSEGEFVDTTVRRGDDLYPDLRMDGPSVIRMAQTTVAVPPGTNATVDQYMNVIIDIGGE